MQKVLNIVYLAVLMTLNTLQVNAQVLLCKSNANIAVSPFGNGIAFDINDMLLPGSSTNWTNVSYSPSNLNCDNVGQNIFIKVTVEDDNGIQQSCTVLANIIDTTPPVVVSKLNIIVSLVPQLGGNSLATITPQFLDNGSYDNCGDILLSLSQDSFTCADVGQSIPVKLIATDKSGNTNYALTNIQVEDKLPPIIILDDAKVYVDQSIGCTRELQPCDFKAQITDNCSSTIQITPAEVTCAQAGQTLDVTFIVTDNSGSTASAKAKVTIEQGKDPCDVTMVCRDEIEVELVFDSTLNAPSATIRVEDILEGNYVGCDVSTFILSLLDDKGNPIKEDIGQLTIYEAGEYIMSVKNCSNNIACWGALLVKDNLDYCNETDIQWPADLTFEVGSITNEDWKNGFLMPENLMSTFNLSKETVRPTVDDCDGLLGEMYEDQIYFQNTDSLYIQRKWTIIDWIKYDPAVGNGIYSAVQNIYLKGQFIWTCTLDEINFPPDVNTPYIDDPSILTPDYLVNERNFNVSEVYPIYPESCTNIIINFNDDISNPPGLPLIEYIINRTFVALDTITNDIENHTQKIYVYKAALSLICDTLPNSAPIGDCDSGHTLSDDVEWPDDITITDYRITPDEIYQFSGIDWEDTRPIFYNTPQFYTYTYADILIGLTTHEIFITRKFSVSNALYPTLKWHYNQNITIDFSQFDNLVTVETAKGIPLTDVLINNTFKTDEFGRVIVTDDIIQDLDYQDDLQLGINVRDLLLMRHHILGIENIPDIYGLISANINDIQGVSTLDLVHNQRIIMGYYDETNNPFNGKQWVFREKNDNTLPIKTKKAYVATKKGDVDGSVFDDIITYPEANINYDDILINNGEEYEIPIYVDEDKMLFGYQLSMVFDTDKIDIIDIVAPNNDPNLQYIIWPNNTIEIIYVYHAVQPFISGNNPDNGVPLCILKLRAKSNTILHECLSLNNGKTSYLLDEAKVLWRINQIIDGQIINKAHSTHKIEDIIVYPNPSNGTLFIKHKHTEDKPTSIEVWTVDGVLLKPFYDTSFIDLHGLKDGLYLLKITANNTIYMKKIMIKL